MLDIPPRLFQPLHIDTSIDYDLDMSKFPGLDDPEQMYQPALLIANDWKDAKDNFSDAGATVLPDCTEGKFPQSPALFDLNAPCVDQRTFQYLIDDVTKDTVLARDCFSFLDTNEVCDNANPSILDLDKQSDHVLFLDTSSETKPSTLVLPPIGEWFRGQKRQMNSEVDSNKLCKKFKISDVSLDLTSASVCVLPVCPVNKQSVLDRGS